MRASSGTYCTCIYVRLVQIPDTADTSPHLYYLPAAGSRYGSSEGIWGRRVINCSTLGYTSIYFGTVLNVDRCSPRVLKSGNIGTVGSYAFGFMFNSERDMYRW